MLFRLDSCCFKRWFYTNTKLKKKQKKTSEHNGSLLFRHASASQHLVVLNRKVEKRSSVPGGPARQLRALLCTPSSLSIPAEGREQQPEYAPNSRFFLFQLPRSTLDPSGLRDDHRRTLFKTSSIFKSKSNDRKRKQLIRRDGVCLRGSSVALSTSSHRRL